MDALRHLPKCRACGGSPDTDEYVREVMGCDEGRPSVGEHVVKVGAETIKTHVCPRKLARPAQPYLRAHQWREKSALQYLFPDPSRIPAHVVEGIDLIDAEVNERMMKTLEHT